MRAAVGRFLDAARKARVLAAYRGDVLRHPMLAARYVVRDREVTNFTYDLENVDEIASFVADALGIAPANVAQFVAELLEDDTSRARLANSGLEHAANFSWRKTAELTWKVYEEMFTDSLIHTSHQRGDQRR